MTADNLLICYTAFFLLHSEKSLSAKFRNKYMKAQTDNCGKHCIVFVKKRKKAIEA